MIARTIVVIALLSSGAWGQTAPASVPAAEAKLVAELYGKRIEQAAGTADPEDNFTLGREMLLAASDSANPVKLRFLLAMEVVKLCAPAGTDPATGLARDALVLADQLQRLDPVEKARLRLQIAQQRLDAARRAGQTGSAIAPLTASVAKAEVALARALVEDEKIDAANSMLSSAQVRARALNLDLLEEEIEEVRKEIKAAAARTARLEAALARLKRAQDEGDAEAIKSARQQAGLIHLAYEGDLETARSFLDGTGHEYEKCVAAGAEFVKDASKVPDAAACNEVVGNLAKAASAAETERAKVRIATVAMNLCRAFLVRNPEGLEATKARLLLVQVEHLAGDSPEDRYLRRLQAGYEGLAGKLTVLPGGGVRASYDFSSRRHLADWVKTQGAWSVAPGKDILVADVPRHGVNTITSRLRFWADKPLKLSFRGSGRQDLIGMLCFLYGNQPTAWPYTVKGEFGANSNTESVLYDGGLRIWSDRNYRVSANSIYQIEFQWDGQKTVTWTVNGQVLCQKDVRLTKDRLKKTSVHVALETHEYPAGFDDVSVEGSVLEDPSADLDPRQRASEP